MRMFKCTTCGYSYGWVLRGGTNKMTGNYIEYSHKHVTECAYCVGKYPDNTPCPGGRGSKRK